MKGISKTVHSTRSTVLGGAPRVLAGALLALASLTAGAAPRFVEVATSAGVDFTHDNGMQGELWMVEVMGSGVGVLDFDGDLDVFLANYGENQFYENLGDGRFKDITATVGFTGDDFSVSASFADINGDGLAELYVANYLEYTLAKHKICHHDDGYRDYCGPQSYPPPRIGFTVISAVSVSPTSAAAQASKGTMAQRSVWWRATSMPTAEPTFT